MTTMAFGVSSLRREQIAAHSFGRVPVGTSPSPARAEHYDCASRLKRMLQRRLAWYGFQKIGIGPIRDCGDETVLVDLRGEDGKLLCWVQVNPFTGELHPVAARRALTHSLAAIAKT